MRYILDELGGPIEYDRYFEYLESIQTQLPANVYRFASDPTNFDLTSHWSLHDAWLEYFKILEPSEGERQELRRIDIQSSYLGPYHDKRIRIDYSDVVSYSLQTPKAFRLPPSYRTGHGDVITHEIRLEDGVMVHELAFSRGSIITVAFSQFSHSVQDV